MFKASAPGSLMLMGEYAVLAGHLALVCAIDKYMHVELTPQPGTTFTIHSALGKLSGDISDIPIASPFQFVLATLKKFQSQLPSGFVINVVSEFSDKVGFASSAAVTVATLSVVSQWLKLSLPPLELVRTARTIVRAVQGLGSGADVAACVFGGIIAYRAEPLTVEKLAFICPLTVVYSGSKTSTPLAVNRVETAFLSTPKLYEKLCQAIGACAEEAKCAIKSQDWAAVGKIMHVHQGLMIDLGVNTPELERIVYTLNRHKAVLGAKISGSGFGDCAIALGEIENDDSMKILPIKMAKKGVVCGE